MLSICYISHHTTPCNHGNLGFWKDNKPVALKKKTQPCDAMRSTDCTEKDAIQHSAQEAWRCTLRFWKVSQLNLQTSEVISGWGNSEWKRKYRMLALRPSLQQRDRTLQRRKRAKPCSFALGCIFQCMFYVYITTGVQQTSRASSQNSTQNTSMRTCWFYFDFKLYPDKKYFLLRSTLSAPASSGHVSSLLRWLPGCCLHLPDRPEGQWCEPSNIELFPIEYTGVS